MRTAPDVLDTPDEITNRLMVYSGDITLKDITLKKTSIFTRDKLDIKKITNWEGYEKQPACYAGKLITWKLEKPVPAEEAGIRGIFISDEKITIDGEGKIGGLLVAPEIEILGEVTITGGESIDIHKPAPKTLGTKIIEIK